jgi:hypothetical protein
MRRPTKKTWVSLEIGSSFLYPKLGSARQLARLYNRTLAPKQFKVETHWIEVGRDRRSVGKVTRLA